MKYLEKYKLFESIDDSVIEDIEDILLELNHDHKMDCLVYSNFRGIAENYILVEIYKPSEDRKLIVDRFHIDTVAPVIERIELYLTQIGFEYDTEYDSDADDDGRDGLDWPKQLFVKFKIKNNNINEYKSFAHNYERIDEKVKWTNYLLAIGLSFIIMNNVKDFNDIRSVYNTINNEKSIPNEKDQAIIDSIRQDVIEIVTLSNKFKKFGKQSIIDSLRTIKILTPPDEMAKSRGVFINLGNNKNPFVKMLLDEPSGGDNFIMIDRSILHNPDSANVVSHELYHYLNKLYVDNDIKITQPILDKKIKDESYGCGKLAALLGKDYKKLDEEKKGLVYDMYSEIMAEKRYYMSDVEMFARWLTFKQGLLNYGIIKDINQKVKLIDVVRDLTIKDNYNIEDDLIVVFCLDLKKMGEIEL